MLKNKGILDKLDLFAEGGGDFVNCVIGKSVSRVFNTSNPRPSLSLREGLGWVRSLCYNEIVQPQTFIFFGPSGSGKGTQAKLLIDEIKKLDAERKILYLETGERFRDFTKETSLTSKLTKEILDKGELVPEFLPIWVWTDFLVKSFSGEEHLFFDGSPRKLEEAKILDSAIKFYKIENPVVVSIEVSNEWATKLMKGRGRADDTDEEIKSRLAWYRENTIPAVEYFKNDPDYKFIPINGEQTIEEVHQELMEKIEM